MDKHLTTEDIRYYGLLEQLIAVMTDRGNFDLGRVYAILKELCVLLRVSRGVTSFYDSPADEQRGIGEDCVCYDSGEESELVSVKRDISPAGMIVVCSAYRAKGAAPFTEVERQRVELVQNMVVTVINRHRIQTGIERMSFQDDDGYHNLRYFMNHMIRQGRAGELGGKVAFRLNLKHFSLINQQIGREAADVAMKTYYKQLEKLLGETGYIGRLGGDNFIAMCEAGSLPRVLEHLGGKTVSFGMDRDAEAEGILAPQNRVTIAALAGAYAIPADFQFNSPEDVMDKIMSAYQAAKSGKNGDIVFYNDTILMEKEKVMRVQQRFNQALRDGEFLVYYQPKVNIYTKELDGAEALCRWYHNGQLIPPMDFIPVLERGSDICRLDFYMLDRVCKDIRRWLDAGEPVVRVSVNLSRRHMLDPDLLEHIIETIDGNGVPHEYVEIELTETTTDVEFKDLKRVVSGLQAVGINTSVDDFGVGYSSLNLIKEIPWNVLKLDRSLLPASEQTVRGSRMFKHVISMAHEIGLKCVAEGVETEEQMKILEDYGCSIAQGFFFDKPLPVEAFEARMGKHTY